MALLDGGLTRLFAGAFGGLYLPAILHKSSRAYDDGGSITETSRQHKCRGQLDSTTEAMRGEAGYTEKDVGIIILQHGVPEPTSDDEITIRGVRFKIASVQGDPAATHWIIRGTPA